MVEIREVAAEGFQRVIEGVDRASGCHCYIAIHNTTLGPALGGVRIYPYRSSADALGDVLRLAEMMTLKSALAEVGLGGGKAVIIADPRREKTSALLHAFAQVVDSLKGSYIAAEDVGSSTEDMARLKEVTPYVAALSTSSSSGDPSHFTAWGVLRGLQALAQKLWGTRSLKGRTIAIQGVGHVGAKLAAHLFWHGANLIISDTDTSKTRMLGATYGARIVDPDLIAASECDIFAPCALGAAINEKTLPLLRCGAIGGSANNQLADTTSGQRLFDQGILYAPDYVINAGGVINTSLEFEAAGYSAVASREKVDRIYNILLTIFNRSEQEGKPTQQVAHELAHYNLEHQLHRRTSPIPFTIPN